MILLYDCFTEKQELLPCHAHPSTHENDAVNPPNDSAYKASYVQFVVGPHLYLQASSNGTRVLELMLGVNDKRERSDPWLGVFFVRLLLSFFAPVLHHHQRLLWHAWPLFVEFSLAGLKCRREQ